MDARYRFLVYSAIVGVLGRWLRDCWRGSVYVYIISYERGSLRSVAPMNDARVFIRRACLRRDGVPVIEERGRRSS